MEPRSLRVGPDGVIHSALRNQLAANPLHNLSYAQNVGYALPGFKPALASSESAGHDSILKGWQYLSPRGVTSLNVSNAGSSVAHAASAPVFPGLNHRTSSDVASAPTASGAAAAAAAAAASAAAIKAQKQSMHLVAPDSNGQRDLGLPVQGIQNSGLYQRLNPQQSRMSFESGFQSQQQSAWQQPHSATRSVAATNVAMYSRFAVTAPASSLPSDDYVPGDKIGFSATAATAASTFQLQPALAVSQKSNIHGAAAHTSDFLYNSSGGSSDKVRTGMCLVNCIYRLSYVPLSTNSML
jgi:hypothetical protein